MIDIKNFYSCSYKELTECIRFRIEQLREIRRFRASHDSDKYPIIRASMTFKQLTIRDEVRELLKVRRNMRKSKCHHVRDYYYEVSVNKVSIRG